MDKPHPSRRQPGVLPGPWICRCALLLAGLISAAGAPAITLSADDARRIGNRIWHNECNGTVAGLTSWNSGENFASLGIGHFIWYPAGERGPFEESFPRLLNYMADQQAEIPGWLHQARECPWTSRAAFQRDQHSARMTQLRDFLAHTVDLQTRFMIDRLEKSLARMTDEAAPPDRERIRRHFEGLSRTPQGCYALIDYVNFKGEGVLPTERYHGQGWGLLQVLEEMKDNGAASEEFARSAAAVLTRRVHNSPPERNESRWLGGWLRRVNSYSRD